MRAGVKSGGGGWWRGGWGVVAAALVAGWGCAVGPDYRRPEVEVPGAYRGAADEEVGGGEARGLGQAGWWELVGDEALRGYIGEALTNNWDARIAVARVLQAEAAAGVARSEFFPILGGEARVVSVRTSERGPAGAVPTPRREYGEVLGTMAAYEVDFWGRIRRMNEAARARLLATRAAEDLVRQAVVVGVVSGYLRLLELDFELEIARRTRAARGDSLTLTKVREEGGVASLQDVRQAEILVSAADAAIADGLRRIEQEENAFNLLLGRNPGPVVRAGGFLEQRWEAGLPAGVPSDLLLRRPDLRAAEQELVAANAEVGQARAAFFPRITLTGAYGYQSVALSDLFVGPARVWQFGPSVSVPVFTGGALRGGLKRARGRYEEVVAGYRQAVQGAFREVSDALVAYRRVREYRGRLEERVAAHRSARELANVRYEGGVTSYLEVLYNDQELFAAELVLAEARLNEMLSVVGLYRALGGGWQRPGAEVGGEEGVREADGGG